MDNANIQEVLNTMVLTRLNHFHLPELLQLYEHFGSATAIVEHQHHLRDAVPNCPQRIVDSFKSFGEAFRRAETEMEYDLQHDILPLCITDNHYPQRLKECPDAPILLYYKGNANLNSARILSVVGTRHCTPYGQDVVRKLMIDLKRLCPNLLVVSGLAYGVDINAHREALNNNLPTIGVLAHGLDDLYPSAHRSTASEMLSCGGLLTEFMTMTQADKKNFVRRNRIIAGMADATLVIESADKGGGLITAKLARSYDREVFAVPGRANDRYSMGCNHLIRDHVAALVTDGTDLLKALGWEDEQKVRKARQEGVERQLFPNLTAEESVIVEALQQQNDQQINTLTVKTNLPVGLLTAQLFELEMKGVVRTMAGGIYHLIG